MNIPFQAVHFMTYEFGQQNLNPTRSYDPASHMLSGGALLSFDVTLKI